MVTTALALTFPFVSIILLFFIEKRIGKILIACWMAFLISFLIYLTHEIIENNKRMDELWESLDEK